MFADVYVSSPVEGVFTYRIPESLKILPGMRVLVNFGRRTATAFTINVHDNAPADVVIKDILSAIDPGPIFDGKLVELARFVSSNYLSSPGEALAMALPSGLKPSGRRKTEIDFNGPASITLSEEQGKIFNVILDLYAGGSLYHLLFGITGSGKTEIYIEICRHFTRAGKSVIFMVPEISLSSQIFQRLSAVFGNELIVYHSGLPASQRLHGWMQFYAGEKKIAVGTRSSVFLQCPGLGAIIIDEEHDGSYKENSTPRYNARRIAFYRTKTENSLLLLGSATPSVETLYASERGSLKLHRLEKRFGNAALPEIEIVKISSMKSPVSSLLKLYTKKAVDSGHQAIYLLNRRGFAPFVICNSCSHVIVCPDCAISLNYHRDGFMLCHYCGYRKPLPQKCGKCGSEELDKVGSGTQRVEELMEKNYSDFRIFRLDRDSARKKGTAADMIGKMKRGEVDILLGTQMVAKGFDFPGVTVVGILLADIGLNIPDFRASERIFSLLVQVAGRCGRGEHRGKVVLQTLNDELDFYRFVKNHDYYGFYQWELMNRKALSYPPYSRIIRLLVRGFDEKVVADSIKILKGELECNIARAGSIISIMGPSAAPFARIGKNFRHHMLLKSVDGEAMKSAVSESRKVLAGKRVYLEIDVDPQDML